MITDNNYATSTADAEIAEKSKPAKIFDQEAYRAEQAEKENAALVGTGNGNMSVGEAGASGNAALPEQGAVPEVKAVPGQEAAVEVKAVPGQEAAPEVKAVPEPEAAPEDNGVHEAGAASTDTEVSGQDDRVEEAGSSDYEESVGSECSEEQTEVPVNSGEAVSEYELSGYAA